MLVMTYSGFGSEILKGSQHFKWWEYDYIICDEMQNLVKYQAIPDKQKDEDKSRGSKLYLQQAELTLRQITAMGRTRIVALSATPRKIYERFRELCYKVPIDTTDLAHLETMRQIPFRGKVEDLLEQLRGKRGILYTTEIGDMKRYIKAARNMDFRANGFWSIHADEEMETEQKQLRAAILESETFPADIDLLVINAASETCMIRESNRPIDFMIIHTKDTDTQTQVRGRYHGTLPLLYYHNAADANLEKCVSRFPESFLRKKLFAADQNELCEYLNIQKENGEQRFYKMPKIAEYLEKAGYRVEHAKDSKQSGQWYYRIYPPAPKHLGTYLGHPL